LFPLEGDEKMEVVVAFGSVLRRLRKARKMTQEQVGISASTKIYFVARTGGEAANINHNI
jgi:hypothetical protein